MLSQACAQGVFWNTAHTLSTNKTKKSPSFIANPGRLYMQHHLRENIQPLVLLKPVHAVKITTYV